MEPQIRPVSDAEFEDWLTLGIELWPDNTRDGLATTFHDILASREELALIAYDGEEPIGFINASIRRDYVEGSDSSPVGYVEG
ncbi:MAG: GNAT family N-acetyltransferase, partial [Actinomycetota bacterium]